MCAILGQFGGNIDVSKFTSSRDVLRHRGPDDAGVFYDHVAALALGNRRLAIIDLTPSGHQPMTSHDGRWVISFNGEIFNYLELRHELEGKYHFRTKSDTEVLLAAWDAWGTGGLSKLNGQFAFAIWDKEKKELFLARDHFGIKPLFYTEINGVLFFASEIKALLALGVRPAVNDAVVFEYLAHGLYDHGPRTFFKGVVSLPPGHFAVKRDTERLVVKPYWDFVEEVRRQAVPQSEEEAIGRLQELIQDAVRLQLRADVPIGVNLSSGIDSATLLHFLTKNLQESPHAFSSCLDDTVYDECQYIRRTIPAAEIPRWHTATLSPSSVFSFAEELIRIEDQPYGGIHTMQYFNLYRTQRQMPVTVLLEGQGMDEILGGYGHFAQDRRKAFLNSFRTLKPAASYLASDFADKMKTKHPLQIRQPFSDDLQNAQFIDLTYRKLPRTLRFNDHIAMAFSKELRLPYLDYRLVSYCFSLPKVYKIQGGVHKYLLRALVKKRIPDAMRDKDRVEFPAFQTKWLREYLREPTMDIIRSASFRARPWWDYPCLVEHVDRFFAGEGDHSFFLWQMIDLEMWMKAYID